MSTATYTPLLPANQTDLEGALVKATDTPAATDAAVAEVKTLYNPNTLRKGWLPWLAWAWDAIYWPPSDLEPMRRKVLRESFGLHRIAGTLASYKRVARYAGFEVVSSIRPPDTNFCGSAMTVAERNAWLRQFPQLRVYPFRSRGKAAGSHPGHCFFATGPFGPDTAEGAKLAAWPAIGDAAARIGERSFLYRDGVETPLVTATVETEVSPGVTVAVRDVRLPGTFPHARFCGGFVGVRFYTNTGAAQRLYRMWDETPYDERTASLRINAVRPSLEPIRPEYEWVAGKGSWTLGRGKFLSCRRAIGPDVEACLSHTGGRACGFVGGHYFNLDAGRRIYKRIYLFDPTVPVPSRGVTSHFGAKRFGMPPYQAVLRVNARRRWSRKVAFFPRVGSAHLCSLGAGERIAAVRNALGPVRAARDKVQFSTRTRGPITASGRLFASPNLVAGAYTDIPEIR